MRALLLLLFLLPVSFNVSAIEPVNEQQLMLYYEIPLGDNNSRENKHQFGLRLDRISHEPGTDVHISSLYNKAAALELRMGYDGVESMKLNGVDYASYLIAKAAAGEETPVEPAAETPAETAPAEAATPPAEGEATTEPATPPAEGEVTTEPAAAETTATAEAPKEELGPIQKLVGELPFGVFLGAAVGLLIWAGAGG